jgi:coenzyme F420-reducing hydrogenase alpha subunit
MAELTNLEEKLAEVTGLAMAAQAAGGKVSKLTEKQDGDLAAALQQMAKEATETEERCTELAGTFEGKKTAILDEAREVKKKASVMMSTYLDSDSDALDGFEPSPWRRRPRSATGRCSRRSMSRQATPSSAV